MSYDARKYAEEIIKFFGLGADDALRARRWASDHPDGTISEAEKLSMADHANDGPACCGSPALCGATCQGVGF